MNLNMEVTDGVLFLNGVIDHNSHFDKLLETVDKTSLEVNMKEVIRINSTGVRNWVEFLKNYNGEVSYHECSVPVVEQFNMIPQFFGKRSRILSFFAPFFCEESDEEVEVLLTCGTNVDLRTKSINGEISCDECDGELSRDFDPDEYLRFFDNSL